jgi:hypothetical protein
MRRRIGFGATTALSYKLHYQTSVGLALELVPQS